MDAAPWVPLLAAPTAGAMACPKAGVAAAAANVTNKRISRQCVFMPFSLHGVPGVTQVHYHPGALLCLPVSVFAHQTPSLSAKSWKFLPTTSNDPFGSASPVP